MSWVSGDTPFVEGALYLAQAADATPLQSVLTFREVMDLRTSARLVVLSACESGLGVQSRGEGIQGLTRAWLFAGAGRLWPANGASTMTRQPR